MAVAAWTIPTPRLFDKEGNTEFATGGALLPSAIDPVTVKLGPVLRDGSPAAVTDLLSFSAVVVRVDAAGGPELAWNTRANGWQPWAEVPADQREVMSLQPKPEDSSFPWQAQVFLVGEETKFSPSGPDYPQYGVRAVFTAADGDSAASGSSILVKLPAMTAGPPLIAGVQLLPSVEAPNQVQLYFSTVGTVTIRDSGEITVTNLAGAEIRLFNNGMIQLTNATGAQIQVQEDGDLRLRPRSGGSTYVYNRVDLVWP